MKTCTACGETFPFEQFVKDPRRRNGVGPWCRPCARAKGKVYSKRHYDRNPETNRKAQWKYRLFRFGVTPEQYDAMLAIQGGVCAICRRPETTPVARGDCGRPRSLAVDHDEQTGHVRGLLCALCNRGIGMLGHDIERIRMAAQYLDRAEQAQRERI